VPSDNVSLIFGKPGSGKSITALAICLASLRRASLGGASGWAVRPMTSVLYLDWEADKDALWRRLAGLCSAEGVAIPTGFHYLRMARPLHASLAMVTKELRKHSPQGMVIDSWAPACGIEPEGADAATKIMSAIRTLAVTTLGIAHVTNAAADGDAPARPFGSIFNNALSRSNFECSGEKDGPTLSCTFRHHKINDGALQPSKGFTYTYSPDGIAVEAGEPDVSKLPTSARIVKLLMGYEDHESDVASMSDELGIPQPNLRVTLGRMEGKSVTRHAEGFGRGRHTIWRLTPGQHA
jgi:hypothetical protein